METNDDKTEGLFSEQELTEVLGDGDLSSDDGLFSKEDLKGIYFKGIQKEGLALLASEAKESSANANGQPEPDEIEQKAAKTKEEKNRRLKKEKKHNIEPLSSREEHSLSLYYARIRSEKKQNNTSSRRVPWQELINKGETEPNKEEQLAANAKYKRLHKTSKTSSLSLREKWARSLYKINMDTRKEKVPDMTGLNVAQRPAGSGNTSGSVPSRPKGASKRKKVQESKNNKRGKSI